MIRQFTDKIDAHAGALKSLIEEQVSKENALDQLRKNV